MHSYKGFIINKNIPYLEGIDQIFQLYDLLKFLILFSKHSDRANSKLTTCSLKQWHLKKFYNVYMNQLSEKEGKLCVWVFARVRKLRQT